MRETCIQHYSQSSLLYAFWYLLPHIFSNNFYASFNSQFLTNVYQSIAISFSMYDFNHFLKVRRDKKDFCSDQCKETEENNRMGKTRDLFKKIRDTKGTFHAKMGSIKDKNGMDLTEAKDIKKSWQEYTEELYKKELHNPDNHDGVITHLEPDILECEVKWALESITTNKLVEVIEF